MTIETPQAAETPKVAASALDDGLAVFPVPAVPAATGTSATRLRG